MAGKDQRYRLPKNRIVLPLVAYSLIFILTIGVIIFSFEIMSNYMTDLIIKSDRENIGSLAEMYDKASAADEDEVFKTFDELGYDYFVTDTELNVIRYGGELTADLSNKSNNDDEDVSFSLTYVDEDDEDYTLLDNEAMYFADRSTRYLVVNSVSLSPSVLKMLSTDGAEDSLDKKSTIDDPFWIGFLVKDNTQIIGFKSYVKFSYSDILAFVVYFAIMLTLAVLVFVVLIVNIVSTHKNAKKMRRLMFGDNITRNRNWLWFVFKSRDLIRKRKAGIQYAVVSLEFTRYRNYVLCHSVEEGEALLRRFWEIIRNSLEKNEICCHSTSANFPILMIYVSEEQTKERIRKIIGDLEALEDDHDFNFQAGVCPVSPDIRKDADIDLIYNNASTARLSLEENDDTGIAFFDDKLVENEKWIDKVSERQKEAVQKEEFKVYYQPKYDPRTDELMGAEALIRWISDEMGFVAPGRFIPIFEENGFIKEIDHYMVSHVARDQKKWLDEGLKCVPVSVNISRAHFVETDLAEQIRDIVDKEGAPHELIEIELTESAFFDDKKALLSTIGKLKEYGFLVSMDDFGSGYSSLNSLKDMPLDVLKLDADFFRGENDNSRSEIVVSEAIQLAKKLEMKTVAEGVEEKEQVDFLAAEGCDMIQGYYYAKPMPKEEFEERITQ